MASFLDVHCDVKEVTFTQQFRQIDAIQSSLHTAVMAELSAETEEKRRLTDMVITENMTRAAAAVALPTSTNNHGFSGDDSDDDGYGAKALIPVSCAAGYDGEAANLDKKIGSGGDGSAGPMAEGQKASGVATPAAGTSGDHRSDDDQRSTPPAAAAAEAAVANGTTAKRGAPASARTTGRGARASQPPRFLEDVLRLESEGLCSVGALPPKSKRKSRPRDARNERRTGSQVSKKPRSGKGNASGPFSGLSLCVVHLGSVMSDTIKTLTRGVQDGGGKVSTQYTPEDTTHIVVDASLAPSLEKLDGYVGGWDDFESLDGTAAGGRSRTPEGVPIVSIEWVSECLRRSEVVASDAYYLTPPPHRSASVAVAAPAAVRKLQQGSGTTPKRTNAAGGSSDPFCAVTAAEKRALAERGEETLATARKETPAEAVKTKLVEGGEQTMATARNQAPEAAGGGAVGDGAVVGSMALEGGFSAKKPEVDKNGRAFQRQSSSSRGQPMNTDAAEMLDSLAKMCAACGGDGSVFKERGFKSAAGVLRTLGMNITNIQQLKDLRKKYPESVRGLGDIAMKELETFYGSDPKLRSLKLFQEVGWVGAVKAKQLYDKGMRSIEDLRTKGQHLLTEQMRFCLNRHEDIKQRMPRSEAAEIEAVVIKVAQGICPEVICQACGSYRRGKTTCGDVDVLIRPPEGQEDSPMFHELISRLTEMGFITDKLSMAEGPHTPGKSQTFMGICKLPGAGRLHRRLDIKLYPTSMFAFAVLYFTGSGDFNMSMRAFAKSKGLKLSDKGLCRVDAAENEVPNSNYSCFREEDVFNALGLEWREPKDRGGVDMVSPKQPQQHQALLPMMVMMPYDQPLPPDLTHGDYFYDNGEQQAPMNQSDEIMLQQQAEALLHEEEEEQVREAIRLSRDGFGAHEGSGGAPATRAGAGAYDGGSADSDLQEALRRSLCCTTADAAWGRGDELWEELPAEAMARGGDSNTATAEGDGVIGAGSEHSPVCL